MDLKGAEIRNILEMCMSIGTKNRVPLKVNIPYYQRPYRWDKERITNLITDFFKNKIENANAEYFVGSVVLVENANTKRYDIIDGQQRVTTVFLFNYLRFLLQRSYVEEMISTKGSNLDGPLQDLEEIYGSLFGSKYIAEFSKMRSDIIELMEPLSDLTDLERDQVYTEIAELYRKTVLLPERDFSNMDKYFTEYENLQTKFIELDDLSLSYSRKTFNMNLDKALAKACVIVSKDENPKLEIIGETEKTDVNILQYTNAIKYEFNAIKKLLQLEEKPLQNTRKILRFMKEFIENVRFCVIMTGTERDAYTLFEVLNDRAMEIDDLELIKNLFLKAYCNTSGDADALIDKNIGLLDQIWGDEVFTRDLSDAHKKLISYLGTLYLTADESAFTNKNERYREIIERNYLNTYSLATNKYQFTKALNDIRVYQMLRVIIDEYQIPVRKAAAACIKAENNTQVSITFKTFHLLNALKLDGVMPALTNIIIRQFMNQMEKSRIKEVDITDFKKYIVAIKDDYQHNSNTYREIHELAFKLWKAALLCKDYEIPREIAKKGLQNISMKEWNPSGVMIDAVTQSEMIQQFREWIQTWQYGKSGVTDLKVKVLFINLFKTKINSEGTELTFDKAVHSFVTDKLQLDHMEARTPDSSNMEKYFVPGDPHELREKYVDSLGNMMILDGDNNNEKNNKPLAEAIGYYENMCAGHWLNMLTTTMLNMYHKDVSIAGSMFKVPTEQFFYERGSKLRTYFEKIVDRDFDTQKVMI